MVASHEIKCVDFYNYRTPEGGFNSSYTIKCRGKYFHSRCMSSVVATPKEAEQDFLIHSNEFDYFNEGLDNVK